MKTKTRKTPEPHIECDLCFEEEGSYACIRFAHNPAFQPKTVSALSDLDAMWSAIDAAKLEHCGEVVARPAGSITSREFAKRYGLSESHSARVLTEMCEKGTMRRVRAYVPSTAGRNTATNVYLAVAA